MPETQFKSAADIINGVAIEVGLEPVADPFTSTDPSFIKLRHLINNVGEDLVLAHPWQFLTQQYTLLTQDGDTGEYPLPDDFARIINQTGWNRSTQLPLGGPLTPQTWQQLQARNVNGVVGVNFRIADNMLYLFPTPPEAGITITFEYVSNNWVRSATQDPDYTYTDEITEGGQTPMLHKTLIARYLKVKYLEATGFDTTKAQEDFNQIYAFLTGAEKGAPILSTNNRRRFPYLTIDNAPDTGYGM